MKHIAVASLIGILVGVLASQPSVAATVTPAADSTSSSGDSPQLDGDTGKVWPQQLPSTHVVLPGSTVDVPPGGTVATTSTDFCGTGASAIVCTDGTGIVPASLLPGLPAPYYINTGSITLTGSGTATATGTGTGTYTVTGTFSGTTSGSGTGTITATATITGSGYATATATGTVTVTVSGSATGTATVTEANAGIGYSDPLAAMLTLGRTGATSIGYNGEITTTQPARFRGTVAVAELDFGTRGSILETTSGFGYGIRIIPNNFNGTLTLRGNPSWAAPGTSPGTIDRWISYPDGALQINGPISATNIVSVAAVSSIPRTTSSSTTLSTDWIPDLPESKITGLVTDLAGKVGCHGTCSTNYIQKWDGTGLTNSSIYNASDGTVLIEPIASGPAQLALNSKGTNGSFIDLLTAGSQRWRLIDAYPAAQLYWLNAGGNIRYTMNQNGDFITYGAVASTNLTAAGHAADDCSKGTCPAGQFAYGCDTNGLLQCSTPSGTGSGMTCSGTCSSPNWVTFSDSTHVTNASYTPVPPTRTVCGHLLSSDVTCTASDVGAVPTSRTVSTSSGLQGGGDLSVNLTLSPVYGTTSGTVAQGDDTRIVNACQSSGTNCPAHTTGDVALSATFSGGFAGPASDVVVGTTTWTTVASATINFPSGSSGITVNGTVTFTTPTGNQCFAALFGDTTQIGSARMTAPSTGLGGNPGGCGANCSDGTVPVTGRWSPGAGSHTIYLKIHANGSSGSCYVLSATQDAQATYNVGPT